MFEIKNKTRGELPVKVKQGDDYKYVYLNSRGTVKTEEITNQVRRYRDKREVLIREVDEEKFCEAEKSNGESCEYVAKYPKDDPKYCGVHKDLLEE